MVFIRSIELKVFLGCGLILEERSSEVLDVNFSWYLVNVFSTPFLTTPSAPMTTGTVIVFNPHISVISISRSLYLDSFSATFTDAFQSEEIAIYLSACMSFLAYL